MTDRPVETLRDGSLKASIWKNEGENGAYYTTTLSKSYQDKEGNWRDTQSFSSRDLLGLGELTRQAYGRINELRQDKRQSVEPERQHYRERRSQNTPGRERHNERDRGR